MPDDGRRQYRHCRGLTRVAALCVLALTASCTGAGALQPTGFGPGAASVLADDERAIRATVDRVNAAAGGRVADQQKVLAQVVDPGSAAVQERCPPTTATLRFEPVYDGLRGAPDWRPGSGSLSGAVYALPALIRIYTGDRVTGTDLTTLHLGVRNGEAWLTPLCVG